VLTVIDLYILTREMKLNYLFPYFSDSARKYPDPWISFTSYVPDQSSTRLPVQCSYAANTCYNPSHTNSRSCSCWDRRLSPHKNIWGWPTPYAYICLEQTQRLQTEGKSISV